MAGSDERHTGDSQNLQRLCPLIAFNFAKNSIGIKSIIKHSLKQEIIRSALISNFVRHAKYLEELQIST